ncbi:MAG: hypothetical protein JJE52_18955 [Acidimicrobiia bacterium]|nr:hypothetical protein [Acidimicrobiia bacterium]
MSTQLKFDGPRLDELLERVGCELGPDAIIVDANRTRRGGVGGFFAKEWFEVIVDDSAPTAAAGAAPASRAAVDRRRPSLDVDPLLVLADQVDDGPARTAATSADSFAGVLAKVGGGHTSPSVARDLPSTLPTSDASSHPSGIHPAAVPVVPPAPRAVAAATALPRLSPDRAPSRTRLRDLPLCEMLLALDQMVGSVLATTAVHPIIAIVGDLSVARGVAASVAARMGLGPADVLVASPDAREGIPPWLRIDSAEAARTRVARWRRGEQPVVLAIDLTPGREGHAWAAEVLAALDADQIRLVARAWQVTEELAAKAAVLGGIDGLELVEVEAAAEPEAFLELDLPVVGIDGRPATSELWAALLMERRHDATA